MLSHLGDFLPTSDILPEYPTSKSTKPSPEGERASISTISIMGTTITQVDAIPLTELPRPASISRPHSVIPPLPISQIPSSRQPSPRVFEAEPTTTLNKSRRALITTLVILASLTQVESTLEL